MGSGKIDPVPIDPELNTGFFPYGYWKEFSALFKLAWPLSLSLIFQYMLQPISIAFCGHLGKSELAGVSLAMTMIYMLMISIGRGLAYGGDTFFAQTYGSENKKNVGIYLQKGIIFGILWSLPIIAVLVNAESLLLVLQQDSAVAVQAQLFCTMFCPGVTAYCCFFMIMRYLLCQNKVLAILVICVISCGFNILINYLLVSVAGLGIIGSALSLCLTYYLILLAVLLYICGSGLYVHTWDGWSYHCLEEWGQYFCVTSFSIVMTIIYRTAILVGTFLGGLISPEDLSMFAIVFEIEELTAMAAVGLGSACTARFGQYLGANKPRGAINVIRVAIISSMMMSVVLTALCFGLRSYIPYIFTTDKDLINKTASLMELVSIFILLEGFGVTAVGVIRGAGRNGTGIVIVLLSYYLVAWPVGILLMFATDMGLYGLWLGLDISQLIQNILLVIFILKCDWKEEAKKAVMRSEIGKKPSKESVKITKPNEETGLLEKSCSHSVESIEFTTSQRTTHIVSKTHSYINFQNTMYTSSYKRNLFVKRLLTSFMFVIPLIFGVFTRVYVKLGENSTFSNNTSYDHTFSRNITNSINNVT